MPPSPEDLEEPVATFNDVADLVDCGPHRVDGGLSDRRFKAVIPDIYVSDFADVYASRVPMSTKSFADLQKLRDQLPPGPKQPEKPAPKGPARAVVRLERKHRGGKEVTLVEKLELKGDALATWCGSSSRRSGAAARWMAMRSCCRAISPAAARAADREGRRQGHRLRLVELPWGRQLPRERKICWQIAGFDAVRRRE